MSKNARIRVVVLLSATAILVTTGWIAILRKPSQEDQGPATISRLKHALDLWADAHDGEYPPDLHSLIAGTSSAKVLELDNLLNSPEGRSVHYVPGLLRTSPSNKVILYSEPDEGGRILICCLNGTVRNGDRDDLSPLVQRIFTPTP